MPGGMAPVGRSRSGSSRQKEREREREGGPSAKREARGRGKGGDKGGLGEKAVGWTAGRLQWQRADRKSGGLGAAAAHAYGLLAAAARAVLYSGGLSQQQ